MPDQTYADEVTAISIHDGVVRLELSTLTPSAKADGSMTPEPTARVLLTIPALARSAAKVNETIAALVEQGILVTQPGPEDAAPAPDPRPAVKAKLATDKVRSPNFPGSTPQKK